MARISVSKFGLVLATIYILVAILIVREDRRTTSGGWITLRGIGAFLITFPVSALGEKAGMQPDYRRNLDMALAIGICALLVYMIGAGLEKLGLLMFTPAAHHADHGLDR